MRQTLEATRRTILTKFDGHCLRDDIRHFLVIPDSCGIVEGLSLGADLELTNTGFPVTKPLFRRPEDLLEIRDISTQPAAREMLGFIRNCPADRDVMLCVEAPYSVLSSAADQTLLYTWLVRYPGLIHSALNAITDGLAGYVGNALSNGARVISIADPYARPDVIGAARYIEYAARYQHRLLKLLANKNSGIIHLCPHCSLRLEAYGYVTTRKNTFDIRPYYEALLETGTGEVAFVGHQCVHTPKTDSIYELKLSDY
ncbi:MAG: hypothetical protein LBU13_10045 [Synergistaceae bacterium]|jgi:uroporphyrinogen-III decarboxylase|nr:hypothetical protein [Synergistaceae bacterium]